MQGSYLGPEFAQGEIERRLKAAGARFTVVGEPELYERSCGALEAGHAVGWFQGRMEFGPRALGARSIVANPDASSRAPVGTKAGAASAAMLPIKAAALARLLMTIDMGHIWPVKAF